MRPVEPLPLNHSWPLFDLREHLSTALLDPHVSENEEALAERGLGLWRCDLPDERLSWTAGVYDLFGLERRSPVARAHAASLYAPDSRDAMERLRAYAISHRRGFTLDVDIDRADGGRCAMRLVAAPVLDAQGEVIALHGAKQLLPPDAHLSHKLDPTIFVML
ncbi:diguanylate cyclase [Sphingobium amiense]|uniref:Diguanylate cyclase n=1 Tax=Sphingobium amiense TaxID=135719 RepID=A0A494WET9_9SPHN|nr:diguanylate cyclase [Sphingobium amiense]BBD99295.1 diguanylate cyclase [Sphingobium amiense]